MVLTDDQLMLIEDIAGNNWLDVRTQYSGRGMYGKTCLAMVGGTAEFTRFILKLGEADREVAKHFSDPSVDNMGLNLVFYFPYVQVKGGETDE